MNASIFDSALSHTRRKKKKIAWWRCVHSWFKSLFACGQVSSPRLYRLNQNFWKKFLNSKIISFLKGDFNKLRYISDYTGFDEELYRQNDFFMKSLLKGYSFNKNYRSLFFIFLCIHATLWLIPGHWWFQFHLLLKSSVLNL